MPRLLPLLLILACRSGAAPTATTTAAPPAPSVPRGPMRPIDTRVLSVGPRQPTPVMVGPFLVTTINPGGLELMISPGGRCDDALWFDYSGGGVAVPDGETLCARSSNARVQAFSGRTGQ